MNGTNPGAWPDQEPNEPKTSLYVDDEKRKTFAELDKVIPLYTAAEMKAARLETVEKCISIAADTSLIASELDEIIERLEMLKEEIEND